MDKCCFLCENLDIDRYQMECWYCNVENKGVVFDMRNDEEIYKMTHTTDGCDSFVSKDCSWMGEKNEL